MMGDRIPPGPFHHYFPSWPNHPFPHFPAPIPFDPKRYFAEILEERQRLIPFMRVLPHCTRLLDQEISRLSGQNQGFIGYVTYEHQSPFRPFRPLALHPSVRPMGFEALSTMKMKENEHLQIRGGPFLPTPMGLPGVPGIPGIPGIPAIQQSSSSGPHLKKLIRLDFPVDKYPNYNFVGRLLGPCGNSLKRVEAYTGCRVFIRGKGSLNPIQEEQLKDDPEYEHLSEPLHVVVEAEYPEDEVSARLEKAVDILERLMKPEDEYLGKDKKDQPKGLATMSPSMPPSGSLASGRRQLID